MMNIDLTNGELKYEEWIFSPRKDLNYFLNLFRPTEMELWSSHTNWISYRLKISKDWIFILYFQDEALRTIDVYPIDNNKGNEISLLLEKLGGEHIYSWGRIELNDDIKAGYKSVLIKYN